MEALSPSGDALYGNCGSENGQFVWTVALGVRPLMAYLEDDLGLELGALAPSGVVAIGDGGRTLVGTLPFSLGGPAGFRVLQAHEDLVVNSTGDEPDENGDGDCDTGEEVEVDGEMVPECTLRAAIELANERDGATITFDIPGGGVPRIDVPAEDDADRLPPFTAAITLDATTQPGGWVELVGPGQSRDRDGQDGDPVIAGIEVSPVGGGSTVRGLVVHGFRDAGVVLRMGADGCLIEGNRIGTDVTGTQWRGNGDSFVRTHGDALPNPVISGGVEVFSSGNVIRGNVLAGNVWDNETSGPGGVNQEGGMDLFFGPTAFDNRVEGNRIGVGADGAVVVAPELTTFFYEYIGIGAVGGGGLVIGGDATGVPGACTGTCNLIAGHQVEMWLISWVFGEETWPGAASVTVEGNHIGVDAAGTIPQPRPLAGVQSGVYADGARVAYNLVGVRGEEAGATIGISVGGVGSDVVGNTVRGDPALDIGDNIAISFTGIQAGGSGATVRGNTVVGNTRWGITAGGEGTVVEGNEVADNPGGGIYATGTGTVITGNHVHDNGTGVLVDENSTARIRSNRIYDNAIGIDLTPGFWIGDGVTLNDYGDGDDGANGLQNFPNVQQATLTGGTLSVVGFISAPLLGSTAYTVDAYLSAGCRSEAHAGGMVFGQGEHFFYSLETASGLGEADVVFEEGNVPEEYTHVSLTATQTDTGGTSEFGRCIPLVGDDRVAQAGVGPDQTGPVLDGQGTTVAVGSALARGADAARHDGGTLYVTRYEATPTTSVFADGTATGPAGTAVTPDAVAARHWLLADRGLTPDGGATSSPATFSVCLDPAAVVLPGSLGSVVVVRRSESTAGEWVPYPTTLAPHGDGQYLCADGLTALGEFGLGGAAASFPVGTEDDGPVGPEPPLAFGLSAYPNPVRGAATVTITVPEAQRVSAAVYDLLGRRVAALHEGPLAAGEHALRWEAGDLPSGVYVVRAVGETAVQTQRVTVVR